MNLRRIMIVLLLSFSGIGYAHAQNLVQNGNFESGLSGWTVWAASSGFWDGSWNHANDCDIWVPTNGCPYSGTTSHAQKKGSGGGNTHGGLRQTLTVIPGVTYRVSGVWSGGVTGNVAGNNGSWWEVAVFEGVPSDATIDTGLRPEDTLIAKRERNNLGNNEVFQFQWEPFSGSFRAQSDTVTLVLKAGSYFTLDAAAYHDEINVTAEPTSIPTLGPLGLVLLALSVPAAALAIRRRRVR